MCFEFLLSSVQDLHGSKAKKHTLATPKVQGGPSARGMVEQWRLPRTVTTLSFIDGALGRSYITYRSGAMTDSVREQLNEELKKHVVIAPPQESSHVWNEETFMGYLNHLSEDLFKRGLGLIGSRMF